jgi:K+-transporting ATPase ATPase A chain
VSGFAILQYGIFLAVVLVLVRPVGRYLQRVFERERTLLDPVMRPVERFILRLAGVNPLEDMDCKQYAGAFVVFSLGGTLLLYGLLRMQPLFHTFDPIYRPGPMAPDLAMNTAISFATTTTWQAYGGETTLTYFSQVVGLAAQNFLAGAAGLAVGIAFVRGLARERTTGLGNFWADLVRAVLWVLLPLSVPGALILIWQGVPLNVDPYLAVPLLQPTVAEGKPVASQVLPMGPVAVLEFIKNLGTNGGGFFNVNGAHPYANPTPLTNFVSMLAITVLPAGFTHTFGRMVGRPRHGWVLLGVMCVLFAGALLAGDWAERGNMEGEETRFGVGGSVLAAVTTSNGATGSYNAMHDSFTPLGGAVPLVKMLLGEIVFGGLGTGLYGMVHGFTEILVAFTSSVANNGQNFAGLNANTPFYNVTTALAMMVGRFGLAVPALALAGLFAGQGRRAAGVGTMPIDTPLLAILLLGTVLIVGALSYLPALALGPIAEHLGS